MRVRRSDGRRRDIWVVVPARGIALGKSRLAETLDRSERARLNRRLLERTLRIVALWQGAKRRCILVSGCARTLRIAALAHVVPLAEPGPRRGLNFAVAYAVRRAVRSGARAVVVLPSDLPRLSVAGLDALFCCATYGFAGALAPDAGRSGTNALLLKTRTRFGFSFGVGSCARHMETARSHGWRFAICEHHDLALDIDVPKNLFEWRADESARRRMV